MSDEKKIRNFTDLKVWKEGHLLVLLVYKITKNFPKEETYSMVDQMRRSAASVTANIAEGFGRQSYKEKIQFYHLAKGSLLELQNFLFIAKDVEYLSDKNFDILQNQVNTTGELLQGFIKKTRTFIS